MTNLAKTSEIIEKVLRQVMEEKFEREWVGLTDEEILDLWIANHKDTGATDAFARAIEAKLKEKNGG
jgi:hypothetical protein